jgi:hypothetical protein
MEIGNGETLSFFQKMCQLEELPNSEHHFLHRLTHSLVFSDITGPVRYPNHQEELIESDSDTESEQRDADVATTTDVDDIVI